MTSKLVNRERNTKSCPCAVYDGVEAGKMPKIRINQFDTLALTSEYKTACFL
jgi:hypothetical protein